MQTAKQVGTQILQSVIFVEQLILTFIFVRIVKFLPLPKEVKKNVKNVTL